MIGAVLFPLVGLAAGADYTVAAMVRAGIRNLGFYFFIWAPGVSIVICVMQYREKRRAEAN
jgi:hypothetical protein